MRNKEKYDLTKLDFRISSSVNNCGRKIDPKHITISHRETQEILYEVATYENVMAVIMRWLESE